MVYNAARRLSKDSREEGDLPDNTGRRCYTNGSCSTSWDILCDALRPRCSSQKRKNKENGRNRVTWDFYSTVRVSFTAIGVVNSIELIDSSWSIELSRPSHCLGNRSSLPVFYDPFQMRYKYYRVIFTIRIMSRYVLTIIERYIDIYFAFSFTEKVYNFNNIIYTEILV